MRPTGRRGREDQHDGLHRGLGTAAGRQNAGPVARLNSTRTVPVGESMPVASGGRDVASAIQTPPTQLPTSIARSPSDAGAELARKHECAERDDVRDQDHRRDQARDQVFATIATDRGKSSRTPGERASAVVN